MFGVETFAPPAFIIDKVNVVPILNVLVKFWVNYYWLSLPAKAHNPRGLGLAIFLWKIGKAGYIFQSS